MAVSKNLNRSTAVAGGIIFGIFAVLYYMTVPVAREN
jgi:hypothetical protein